MNFIRLRTARPSDDLAAIERFYVDVLGCTRLGGFTDHAGFDGLIVGAPDGAWQIEFVHERGVKAPPVPSLEHLLVFYLPDRTTLQTHAAAIEAAGYPRTKPNNPYWAQHGATFIDPDGYHVVLAVLPDA